MEYLTLSTMYNVFIYAPSYLCSFRKVSDVHSHNTRNSNNSYVIPRVMSYGIKSFMYNGAKSWNALPNHVRTQESKDAFKTKCKAHLFREMLEREESEFVV